MRTLLLLLPAVLAASPALGQGLVGTASTAGPGAPRLAPPSAPPEAPPTSPKGAPDPVWRAYHAAFVHVVLDERDDAWKKLAAIRDEHPGHPAAEFAADLLTRLQTRAVDEALDERYGSRKPSGLARAELASFQTLAGIAGAGFACGIAECDDGRLVVGALALGGAAGLTASLLLTEDGISPGRALAINTGTAWGIWNGGAIAVAAQGDGQGTFGSLLIGQLAGLGAGVALAHFTDPTSGDVSLATSGGLWLGGLTFMVFGLADFPASGEATVLTTALVSDLGLLGGGLLSALDIAPMSRARALLIDSGGVLGTLIGMGLSVLIKGEVDSAPAFFGPAIAGALVGLGSATYLSRNWDAPDIPVSAAVTPLRDGAALTFGGTF